MWNKPYDLIKLEMIIQLIMIKKYVKIRVELHILFLGK